MIINNCIKCDNSLFYKDDDDFPKRANCNSCNIQYVFFKQNNELVIYFNYNDLQYLFCYYLNKIEILIDAEIKNSGHYDGYIKTFDNKDNKIYSYNQIIAIIENQIFE